MLFYIPIWLPNRRIDFFFLKKKQPARMKRQERVGLVVNRITSSPPYLCVDIFYILLPSLASQDCLVTSCGLKKAHSFHIFTSRFFFFGCRCSNCTYEIILTISRFYFCHFPGFFNKAQPEMSLPSPLF